MNNVSISRLRKCRRTIANVTLISTQMTDVKGLLLHIGMFKSNSVKEFLKIVEDRMKHERTKIFNEKDKPPRQLWS